MFDKLFGIKKGVSVLIVLIYLFLMLPGNICLAAKSDTKNISLLNFDLDQDGSNDFTFQFYLNQSDLNIQSLGQTSKKYKYLDVLKSNYQLLDGKGGNIGYVELTFQNVPGSGTVYFIDFYSKRSYTNLCYSVLLKNSGNRNYTVRIADEKKVGFAPIQNPKCIQNKVVNYIESDKYIKLLKTVETRYLGYSVYDVNEINQYYSIQPYGGDLTVKTQLTSNKKVVRTGGVFSIKPLINWENDLAYRTVLNMDIKNNNMYFPDGIYKENYTNYFPRSPKSYHKNPSGLQVRSCKWVLDEGSLFGCMGVYAMYAFANSYNNKGYIPTIPKSEWLEGDFGIEFNFYDTRFNSDTISSLIAFYHNCPDEYVLNKIRSYMVFYKKYFKEKSYSVNGILFVPDYMDYTGNNRVPHCSLNHFIAETEALYEYYELTGDQEALSIARRMVGSIKKSSKNWVRPNGDLWYKVTPKGQYTGDDYPTVTYNDLVNFKSILTRIEKKVPDEISGLLESKKDWAKRQGYIK